MRGTLAFALLAFFIAGAATVTAGAAAGLRAPVGSAPAYRDASAIVLAPIGNAGIGDHISRLLPAPERRTMQNVMLALPARNRYNVVYVDRAGHVHANYPDLIAIARFARAKPGQGNALRDGSRIPLLDDPSAKTEAHAVAQPYSCSAPPASRTTGPYRAVYSTCNTPYVLSDVYLPCKSNGQVFLNYPDNEEPYIYEGGFSSNGDAIDAGVAYSWTYDNWSLFVSGDSGFASISPRYRCNQTVPIEYFPVSTTLLAVDVTGYTAGGYGNFTVAYAVDAKAGWSPSCGGCIVKRITSIGQRGFGGSNFSSGSYFALDAKFNPTARWGTSYVGSWTGRMPARYKLRSWTSSCTGSDRAYPDRKTIRVRYDKRGNETDGISLE